MRIIADTNLLLRYVLCDDPVQYQLALESLALAEAVVVTNVALCEFVWVLRSRYGVTRDNLAAAVIGLRDIKNAVFDSSAVEAGLAMLEAGADFADGVIAHEGRWLGGEEFVSFDRKAVALLKRQGRKAESLT